MGDGCAEEAGRPDGVSAVARRRQSGLMASGAAAERLGGATAGARAQGSAEAGRSRRAEATVGRMWGGPSGDAEAASRQ